jgi:hypothetical protein
MSIGRWWTYIAVSFLSVQVPRYTCIFTLVSTGELYAHGLNISISSDVNVEAVRVELRTTAIHGLRGDGVAVESEELGSQNVRA